MKIFRILRNNLVPLLLAAYVIGSALLLGDADPILDNDDWYDNRGVIEKIN
jgi:hypothetical protein